MNHLVNLKDLRENVSAYADRVAKGDSFIVMRRSKPLFKISPVADQGWETIIDFTQFKKDGISASELLTRMQSLSYGRSHR